MLDGGFQIEQPTSFLCCSLARMETLLDYPFFKKCHRLNKEKIVITLLNKRYGKRNYCFGFN